jgi:hypothetical protein
MSDTADGGGLPCETLPSDSVAAGDLAATSLQLFNTTRKQSEKALQKGERFALSKTNSSAICKNVDHHFLISKYINLEVTIYDKRLLIYELKR